MAGSMRTFVTDRHMGIYVRRKYKTSYLSHTESTDFRSGSVQFTAESTKKSPIYDRVNQNSPIYSRDFRMDLAVWVR